MPRFVSSIDIVNTVSIVRIVSVVNNLSILKMRHFMYFSSLSSSS